MTRRLLQHVIVFGYVIMMIAGFIFAVSRMALPIPRFFTDWSYRMIAPFQGYDKENYDVLIDAKRPDGSWQTIDPATLLSLPRSKRTAFFMMSNFKDAPIDERYEHYKELANGMLSYLQSTGEDYDSLRMSFLFWPQSPLGIEHFRDSTFARTIPVIQVP